ncbi:MAG TPA: class I SAM-dependent methyltransferase [Gemmatimonadales bacterium]|nr:class I SAM-dependent methyltransferase [Gemmatimonadales bacterium]
MERLAASFRDPSGFVFEHDGILYRYIARDYAEHYTQLMSGGLYDDLVAAQLLVPHAEVATPHPAAAGAFRIIAPTRVDFVSYPYEWCFGQLRAAALCTLAVARRALARGMLLKDASAFNVQFDGAHPVFIDTLSFERYVEGTPWPAYRQFCEHFLAPLLLMAHVAPDLSRLLRVYPDGLPLGLASRLLGWRAPLSVSAWVHLRLHSRSIARGEAAQEPPSKPAAVSRRGLESLLEHLEEAVSGCRWQPAGTVWADYDRTHSYSTAAFEAKREIVDRCVRAAGARRIWDLGANTGTFSRIAADAGAKVLSLDADAAAVELNFRRVAERTDRNVLPLLVDLTNPTPPLGWALRERASLPERGPAGMALALALVHHLAIGHNLSFAQIAGFFRRLAPAVLVEFVPKDDPMVQRLLAARRDIFPDYTEAAFVAALEREFPAVERQALPESERVLFFARAGARKGAGA